MLGADDLSGSTFIITNPGPLGGFASAAIINRPNVAILSTEGVARRPVVVGDAIVIRHTCILGLSYDHRAFDGVTVSRLLLQIRDTLQDRGWDAEWLNRSAQRNARVARPMRPSHTGATW